MTIRYSLKISGFLLMVSLLLSCGQKGPLYMQDQKSEAQSQQTEKPVKK